MPWPRKTPLDPERVAWAKRCGALLRRVRLEAGVSQAWVAWKLGVPPPRVSEIENGKTVPKLWNLSRYGGLFGVPVEEFRHV